MFDSIFFNGNEYNQMWLNSKLIWEKEVVSSNVIITYVNTGTSAVSSYDIGRFEIINRTLPYSINGVKTNNYTFPVGESTLKLVNLKPFNILIGADMPTIKPINIEYLDLSGTTDLSDVFGYYKFDNIHTYSWSPQNFIFNQKPTNMSGMFRYCQYLTDEDFAEVLPILETLDTSDCTGLGTMFYECQSLTELDLSWLNTSNVYYYVNMFAGCTSLKELHLESWDTTNAEYCQGMFFDVSDCTIYISDKWTLGTESDFGDGTNLTFVRNGEIVDNNVYGDIVLTTQSLYATENVESSLGVRLSQQPTNNQTVNYVYTSEFETWSGSCTFTSDDWDVIQYIEFVPALDGVYTDRTDTITFTSDNVASVNCTIYVTNTEQEEVEVVYPYSDADCVITYMNTDTSAKSATFTVIDSSLPYSINGTSTTSFSFPASSETQVKLVNLKPISNKTLFPVKIEQLRLPNLTDLSNLFAYFCRNSSYEYSWSPQYFEFSENITNIEQMFNQCQYLTDDMMAQFMPYFPNVSHVTAKDYVFWNCISLTSLDLTSWDVSNWDGMYCLFYGCSGLKTLDLSTWDTSNFTRNNYSFNGVKDCTIYINDNLWTLGTESNFNGGSNLTFVVKLVPIESIDSLTTNLEDTSNVNIQSFSIIPIISPSNWCSDLEVIYDSTYMTMVSLNNFTLLDGSQGKTFDITYRSKTDNSISKTITITVSEDLLMLFIDYTQETAPILPSWYSLYSEDSRKFSHGVMRLDNSGYGLTTGTLSTTGTSRSSYQIVAPITGILQIKYRANAYSSTYPFTIHVSTTTSTPSYSSSTDRIVHSTGNTYRYTDGVATVEVVEGTTYYIVYQYRHYKNHSSYGGGAIREVKIIPSE